MCVSAQRGLVPAGNVGWIAKCGISSKLGLTLSEAHLCWCKKTGFTTDKLKDCFMMDYLRQCFSKKCFLSHKGQRSHNSHSGPSIKQTYSHQRLNSKKMECQKGLQHSELYVVNTAIQWLWWWLSALCLRLRSCFSESKYRTEWIDIEYYLTDI